MYMIYKKWKWWKLLKLLDKFLKILKTDRNTFFTYILTLITIYLVVDRFVDLLIMIFTGIASSYWNPIQYTLAFACPVFAFLFSCSSKFAKSQEIKLSFFYSYVIALYILIISMFSQWINAAGWFGLLSLPKYPKRIGIVTAKTGAAIKDILSTIKRRYPICETILFPALVQGTGAKESIVEQLNKFINIS